MEKSGGSSSTLYWYMTPGIVAESDLAGNLKSEYVLFDGERVARRDFDPSTGTTTGVSYYFSDHLKTASVITDSAGNIQAESDYYPWGGELQFVNNDSNHYKFTGKERDNESGLDYFGARYYSNGLGRFLTPDWAAKATAVPYAEFSDPQSLNLYGYVRNLPTTRFDADGHDPRDFMPFIVTPELLDDISHALNAFGHFMTSGPLSGVSGMPSPCTCSPAGNQQSNTKSDNNNSYQKNADAKARLDANKAQGKAFEKELKPKLESKQEGVVDQLTVKTESGTKTRVDFAGKQSGDAALTEAKSSQTAPLTPNQAKAFPEIEQTGATVVGKGKPGFPGGSKIPPTKVDIIRPIGPE